MDLILLIVTAFDLRNGAEAGLAHGIAAVYIGVSIAFGHSMIRWADIRFAHRFAGGPAPEKKPKFGEPRAHHERIGWYRHLLAWAIGCVILLAMVLGVNEASRTEGLVQIARLWTVILAIDFAISFSYTVWPKQRKEKA